MSKCKFFCCNSCSFCRRAAAKKGLSPNIVQQKSLKYVKEVSCVDHLSFVQNVTNVPVGARLCRSLEFCPECNKCPCRGQIAPILGKIGGLGGQSHGHKNPQRTLHPPIPDLTKLDRVTYYHKLLCKSSHEQLPDRGIACTYAKECSRTGQKSDISRFLKPTLPGSQTQSVESYLSSMNKFLKTDKFKMGTPYTIRTSI